jgi:SAM-dependent methyltransferase
MAVKKWFVKALVQRGISFLPASEKINRFLQKKITGKDKLNNVQFENKLRHATDHLNYYKKYSTNNDFSTIQCLELGTGRFPIVPIIFYLHGVKEIYSIDVVPFLTLENIKQTLAVFRSFYIEKKNIWDKYLSDIEEDKLACLEKLWSDTSSLTINSFCSTINLTVKIEDARKTAFKDSSIDFISSNNTLEHIYPEILEGILIEFYRILKTDGIMSHFIDMTDHFAHFDKSITVYNFLKFSERTWRMLDNNILPQNRMRQIHYEDLYKKLNIPTIEIKKFDGDENLIESKQIHEHFAELSKSELAVTHSYMVTKKV